MTMVNGEMNSLKNYFNRPAAGEGGNSALEAFKKIKAKSDAIKGKGEAAAAGEAESAAPEKTAPRDLLELKFNRKSQTEAEPGNGKPLSWEEKRQGELKAILDRLNSEEAPETESATAQSSGVLSPDLARELSASSGLSGFLNDLPLFDEFKTGLMNAFQLMDKGGLGAVSAQYELNFSAIQQISGASGLDYRETSLSLKLDLNYLKASAGGGKGGQALAELIGGAGDFASLIEALGKAASGQAGQTAPAKDPNDFLDQLNDYFSPEKTAGRIVDFSTAFFPNSAAFKSKGDTEEARNEFAEMMRAAIQKGFDQAMGVLGKVPDQVQANIDRTHELTFQGMDDFVKNGLNRQKESEGVYASLEQWSLSFSLEYSEKTVRGYSGDPYKSQAVQDGSAGGSGLNLQA
ncbi:MAG: DUF5610 domain-containing protein [Planctomycetota bacterium]|nr:DUF5610 domain-containing protein [Planctomycetota bacterium]